MNSINYVTIHTSRTSIKLEACFQTPYKIFKRVAQLQDILSFLLSFFLNPEK